MNPYTDKLALTCEIHIWAKTWHTVKSKVYESIINSDFRLTYEEVDKIVKNEIKSWEELMFRWIASQKLIETINQADSLKNIILEL